jgi:hypothetical protein
MLKDDPVIAKVRESRACISEKYGHDAKKVVEYYIKLQKRHQSRLVKFKKRSDKAIAAISVLSGVSS